MGRTPPRNGRSGETPNLAARLQALATPNQLVIDPVTKRLVGHEVELQEIGAFLLKGSTPRPSLAGLSIRLSASRFESYRSSHLTNFVGREQEIYTPIRSLARSG